MLNKSGAEKFFIVEFCDDITPQYGRPGGI